MVVTKKEILPDRLEQLKAFDETRGGVKELVDRGTEKVPLIFARSEEDIATDYPTATATAANFRVPVIDLGCNTEKGERKLDIINSIRTASETVGFFQVVNHGIPIAIMQELLKSMHAFFELPKEEKVKFYIRDFNQTVKCISNFDLYITGFAHWRDSLAIVMDPQRPAPVELPSVCRDVAMEYSNHIHTLATTLFELLSESLGLDKHHLKSLGCAQGHTLQCSYYPPCPEPELALGLGKHTDPSFITILLQDHIGGLQVLHEKKWVNIPPIEGALVINIGDLLQLLSNDVFKSVEHRVVLKNEGSRISVGAFCKIHHIPRVYGPIKELTSEKNPPKYGDITGDEYLGTFLSKGIDGVPPLQSLKL